MRELLGRKREGQRWAGGSRTIGEPAGGGKAEGRLAVERRPGAEELEAGVGGGWGLIGSRVGQRIGGGLGRLLVAVVRACNMAGAPWAAGVGWGAEWRPGSRARWRAAGDRRRGAEHGGKRPGDSRGPEIDGGGQGAEPTGG
ncbi:uncharacterized protein LOC131873995 [Cryptomeria japonica]|uniref:uncharacterized protein LOC131873995 n=1 Tax=Cryptomeria japonica TaxID=3369 RepID=UPI0027DA3AD7|nr:uncharacterized protein LOC131873995 [Cryptomeria japonica]